MNKSKNKRAVLMEFAEWLRQQLAGRPDLNQLRLAELLGIDQSSISKWMGGKVSPRPENIVALAHIFGIGTTTLYQILGWLPPSEANDGVTLNADEIEIFRDLEELRGSRTYPALIVAMKALLDIAKQQEDSPPGG